MKLPTMLLTLFILIFNAQNLSAQDSTFSIQSFQPQNIKDGQIRLKLDGYNYGNSGKTETAATPEEDENDSHNIFRYNFSTSPWFKYESPQSFYYLNPRISFRHYLRKNDDYSQKGV